MPNTAQSLTSSSYDTFIVFLKGEQRDNSVFSLVYLRLVLNLNVTYLWFIKVSASHIAFGNIRITVKFGKNSNFFHILSLRIERVFYI